MNESKFRRRIGLQKKRNRKMFRKVDKFYGELFTFGSTAPKEESGWHLVILKDSKAYCGWDCDRNRFYCGPIIPIHKSKKRKIIRLKNTWKYRVYGLKENDWRTKVKRHISKVK